MLLPFTSDCGSVCFFRGSTKVLLLKRGVSLAIDGTAILLTGCYDPDNIIVNKQHGQYQGYLGYCFHFSVCNFNKFCGIIFVSSLARILYLRRRKIDVNTSYIMQLVRLVVAS